ncbi:MBL fold metallo-hydrolase [Bacillus sp. ISL-51]|uniref:MBL fold metallo-hydrolase n=1 Tax=unclassified Bacillus (in: firmicutes) TaxID=185979 RepID=UPI001BE7C0B7|nr:MULTISPECIES: MBL fold metallo-hydrolase [unclassified Bacillus (in: firmicutes)]MBT2574430.1 MBL fold metallo-hydrolase [Bacillus sp. ISL-51]MBT2633247.1 MBL fold metallo-hydrolase [Bacillus sp. ISL-26]
MKWRRMPAGPIQANAYFLISEDQSCLIFDPGGEPDKINNYIKEKNLKPLAILLTHAHFDHIGALDDVRDKWNVPVYLHKNEEKWLEDPSLNGSGILRGIAVTARPADRLIEGDGALDIGPFHLETLFTPGHSPGSVSYYVKDADLVISGDVLFQGGIGRTDLHGGSQEVLLKSIHQKLLTLPEHTLVLSGHGPETDVQTEQEQNPFINGFSL